MKKCTSCNNFYNKDLMYCPYCYEKGLKIFKKVFLPVLIFLILLILINAISKKEPYVISASDLGEKYPYTIDNVKVKCADKNLNAVYIIDKNNNKYAINGNADIYFKKIKPDKNYKGYTTSILKNGMTDTEILDLGFLACKE